MRKWRVPLTILGLGGIGVLIWSERGRAAMRWIYGNIHRAPDNLQEWNDAAQHELDKIQSALTRVAATLETAPLD